MTQPFVVTEDNKLVINPSVRQKIENCSHPIFLVLDGTTRLGKSTTLNQLIYGYNKTPRKFTIEQPFKRGGNTRSITQGCDIYGPMDVPDFFQRNSIEPPANCDAQVFLVDTEGFN